LLVAWLIIELILGGFGIKSMINHYFEGIELKIAMIYFISCMVEGLISEIFMGPVYNLAKRISPDTEIDDYSMPKYITRSLEDTDIGVDLVHMELSRLIKRFSEEISNVKSDYRMITNDKDFRIIYDSNLSLIKHINNYLTEIFKSNINQGTAIRLMLIQAGSEIISSLNDVIYNFINEIKNSFDSNSLGNTGVALIEGLDAILLAFNDCADNNDYENLDTLLTLTSDKGQVLDNLRLTANSDNDDSKKSEILYITNLFQRAVWLINRWASLQIQSVNV